MDTRSLRPHSENIRYAMDPIPESPSPPKVSKKVSKGGKACFTPITKNHSPPEAQDTATSLQSRLPEVPDFTPMAEQYPLHKAYNRLPPSLHGLKAISPASIFQLFFTDRLFQTMATNTNSYTKSKREAALLPGRDWTDVTTRDLKLWIGICIYMGLFSAPAVEDYWKHDGLHPTHPITMYMSLNRFQQIKRYLHISAVDLPKHSTTGRHLWHGKVDPLLNQLCHASQSLRIPSSNVSIDEAMIRCTGRSLDTYKMPSKPIEHGFKFHCLADHGYSNQAGPDPVPVIESLTSTGKVVII